MVVLTPTLSTYFSSVDVDSVPQILDHEIYYTRCKLRERMLQGCCGCRSCTWAIITTFVGVDENHETEDGKRRPWDLLYTMQIAHLNAAEMMQVPLLNLGYNYDIC